MFKFSKRSWTNLKQCHPHLQLIIYQTIRKIDCSVVCGHRSKKKQNTAYLKGYSKLKFPKSKHNKKPSMAVDVIPYPTGYKSIPAFKRLAKIVKRIAKYWDYPIVWGGDWGWKDYPHYEVLNDK